jgi:putative acyl-CoA dehydrogenase
MAAQQVSQTLSRTARATHTVFNQSTYLTNYNVFKSDPSLQIALKAWGGDNFKSCEDNVVKYGKACGDETTIQHAETADKNKPIFHQFDKFGRRIDVVEYHPSYHALMDRALTAGCASHGYNSTQIGSHVVRCALGYMETQTESGHSCPITMTFSAIPALRKHKGYEEWVKKLCNQGYDPRNVPISEKKYVTIGMSMTEKQGGSDVRINTTIATPLSSSAGNGAPYSITGHKWFTSAPMSDAFLTLAKLDENSDAPTCFLVPRWLPDGTRNTGFRVMRLKNKLGDHANGSSEVEYDGAWGSMIGEPGKGVKTIIEMVQSTRLDCALGSAGTARRALHLAIHHAVSLPMCSMHSVYHLSDLFCRWEGSASEIP